MNILTRHQHRQQRLEAFLARTQPGLPLSVVAALVREYLRLDCALRTAHQAQGRQSEARGGRLILVDSYIDEDR